MNAAIENAGPGVPVWGRDSVGLGVSEGGRGLWSWEGGTPVWGGSIILGWWRTVLVSVISAYKRGHVITSSPKLSQLPYSGKLLREKTFAIFAVLWLFVKVFSTKFGGVVSFGTAKASNPRKFSPRKSHFSPISETFLPRKFSARRYEFLSILLK